VDGTEFGKLSHHSLVASLVFHDGNMMEKAIRLSKINIEHSLQIAVDDMLTFAEAFADVPVELAAPPCRPPLIEEHHDSSDEESDDQNMPTTPATLDHPVGLNEARDYLVECNGGSLCNLSDATLKKRKEAMKVWNAFCTQNDHSAWIDKPNFLESDGSKEVSMPTVEHFAAFFVQYQGGNCSKSQFKKILDFMQDYVNQNLFAGKHAHQRGLVRNHTVIKSLNQTLGKAKAKIANELNLDVHAGLNVQLTRREELDFVTMCYSPSSPEVARMWPLSRTQVAMGFCSATQTCQRSQDLRGNYYKMNFTRPMTMLGPGGTEVDYMISNEGKSNPHGNLECRAMAPHRNPVLDGSAHAGLGLLLRHSLLGEPFPSFLDFDAANSYCRRHTLRAIWDYQKPISEQVYREQWSTVLDACGIFTGKITHQPRRDTQQKLLDKGVSEGNVQRMGFYASSAESKLNDSQKYSYINNPPVQGVCAAADGDPANTRAHLSVCFSVDVLDDTLLDVAPYYFKERAEVEERWKAATDDKNPFQKRKNERLFMARGCLDSLKLRLKRGVQLAASRPYDTMGRLLIDSEPLYILWGNFPLFSKHAFFRSEAFLDVVRRVRVAQDKASEHHLDVSEDVRNELHRLVDQKVTPQFEHQQNQLDALAIGLQNGHNLLVQIWNRISEPRGSEQYSQEEDSAARSLLPRPEPTTVEPTRQLTTKKGAPRQKRPKTNILEALPAGSVIWSRELKTARDYWVEFEYGMMGKPPLRKLEDEHGSKWRSDKLILNVTHQKSTAMKTMWSQRTPIYNWILYRTEQCDEEEELAIQEMQAVFDRFYSRNRHPHLGKIAKELRGKLRELKVVVAYGKQR
jgi:hypothetical protein